MFLPLTKKNDPVWKQKFKNIHKITPEIKKLVSDMRETLELTTGVGLAAPQVGSPLRLFIVSFGDLDEVFINPNLISRGKEPSEHEEGCLSVPRVWGIVSRPTSVEIDYIDLKGRGKKAQFSGYYARIVQHEYDHLSSAFFLDRVTDKKRLYSYKQIKVVFFGTPEFGATVLKGLIGKEYVGEYEIPLVITTPDKPSGRGRKLTPSPVKQLAKNFGLRVETPVSLRKSGFLEKLKSTKPDFLVLASYGKIIPKEILQIPLKAPLNVHPSLLPKYRGSSPIQTAILKGAPYTGVTIIKMNEKLDEGYILARGRVKIGRSDTTSSLSFNLAKLGGDLANYVIHALTIEKIKPKPQNAKMATYTKSLTKEDGLINWKKPPKNLERMIRAYYPWPGVWTKYKDKILKLLPNQKVQLEGKQPIPLQDFKKGHKDFTLSW
jgi:methionyl-tRNA formyltransferase